MEDQADRVGLRYAYEAGYDITKGPRLWSRFAKKYGEGNKVANFFFGDHSLSSARATKLEKEIAYNYPERTQAGRARPGGPALGRGGPGQRGGRARRGSGRRAGARGAGLRTRRREGELDADRDQARE